MKKFLLTWYGITDFRASLGFESTEGPIAAALAAEDYSEIVILGYTRNDLQDHVSAPTCADLATRLAAIHAANQQQDRGVTNDFVSNFANTPAAHAHFARWLEAQLPRFARQARISLKSETLRELNDSEGIYACAMRALDFVAKAAGEKLVTLYLSPGTPVMAFMWALAALAHPHLKKRLIVSPVVGKPPEAIALPAEWLERHGASQAAIGNAHKGFAVTYHLFGEQRMPALLGIRQFASDRHVFVNSLDFPAACMSAFIQEADFDELPVNPWDAMDVQERIIAHARTLPPGARIGMNLTGGTKLMFAGALSAARALGAVPFYFDSRNQRVTYVDSLRRETIRPIDSIETFLLLNGDGLKVSTVEPQDELSPDRRRLTKTLWKYRSKVADAYPELCRYNNEHERSLQRGEPLIPFRIECHGFVFAFTREAEASVVGNGLNLHFKHWAGFAKYMSGGWFEEFVYLQCKTYEERGVIRDLRINLTLQLNQDGSFHRDVQHNELDVTFTDGHSLYIVECKAGKVTQEQVMKLQNLVRFYGGVEGRGIVACCFPPRSDSVRKKISDAKLALCCGGSFLEQLDSLMSGIAARARLAREPA
ncbi:DUF1887 family protein [Pseudomonas sp. ITEM 17296]|jgi:hypothetical protein|uniref:Card1-like endonuclease domain-containing protein n=1 Tax=Pseudomonas TaxID=286 RepID=UPI0021607FCE|nr:MULTISPECIES: DUF1887 family CARF protein [Pseudomonas]MDE4536186.1 DUF1887 family protein [Pseudomonas sp. ITEM 17296]UVL87185.1 DUF1887 family CARF protein [Pseudomonas sichuanensis]